MFKVGNLVKLVGLTFEKEKNIIGAVVKVRGPQCKVLWFWNIPDYCHRESLNKTFWFHKELQKFL